MNIVFMGSPDIAKEALEFLYMNDVKIDLVITNPDKRKGRGKKYQPTPVKEFAQEKNLNVITPTKITDEIIKQVKEVNPTLIVVVAYGKILPKAFLEIPKKGSINLHVSLLPLYRGAAPIQWSIINGEKETGVTIMYMNEKMDEGDIILTEKIIIEEEDTSGTLFEKASKVGKVKLLEAINLIKEDKAPREKQIGEPTFAPMISKDMANINWNMEAEEINNLIRGLNPFLGAKTNILGINVKIWKARNIKFDAINDKEILNLINSFENINREYIINMLPAEVIYNKESLYIKAKDGLIKVLELQPENSRKMNIKSFLSGYSNKFV